VAVDVAGGTSLPLVPVAGIEALLVALDVGSLELAVLSAGGWSVPVVGGGGVVLGTEVTPEVESVGAVLVGLGAAGSVAVSPVVVAAETELEVEVEFVVELEELVAPALEPDVVVPAVLDPYVFVEPSTEVGTPVAAPAEADAEPAAPAPDVTETTALFSYASVPSAEPPDAPVAGGVGTSAADAPPVGAPVDGAPAGLKPAVVELVTDAVCVPVGFSAACAFCFPGTSVGAENGFGAIAVVPFDASLIAARRTVLAAPAWDRKRCVV
jgi:hypothetical protein